MQVSNPHKNTFTVYTLIIMSKTSYLIKHKTCTNTSDNEWGVGAENKEFGGFSTILRLA